MNFFKRAAALLFTAVILSSSIVISSNAVFTGSDKINVVLDPGHGGRDPGSAGISSEAYYNLKVAMYARDALLANGNFNVYMTRETADKYLTLAERMYYADTVNADIAISIHFNSSTSQSIGGIEVYGSVLDRFYAGELGLKIASKLSAATGITNRGVFRKKDYGKSLYYWSDEYQWDIQGDSSLGTVSDYYGIITWAAKFGFKSLIVEHAYLSNPSERNLVESESVLRAMGEADAEAIIEYYTNHTHSYGSVIADAPVTCFSAGKQSEHCSICDHRRNVTSIVSAPDPTKHLWINEDGSTSPTCENNGYAKRICRYTANLNDKGCTQFSVHKEETVLPALEHDYSISASSEVTHTADGYITYTCNRCGSSYNEIIPAEGHSYEHIGHADPNCTDTGYDLYRCSICGEEYSDTIPALGHSFEILARTEPECEKSGSESRRCTVCSFEETLTLDPLGHSPEILSHTPANCTQAGFIETKCSVCGKEEHTDLPSVGHIFEAVAEKPASCESSGEQRQQCTVCGEEQTVILSPAGHTLETLDETSATCDTVGHRRSICTVCQKEVEETLPALGHDFIEAAILREPGLIIGGKAEYVCQNDNTHTEIRAIRDLTVFEYSSLHRLRFTAMCVSALICLAAAVTAVILFMRRKKAPALHAHAKKRHSKKAVADAEPISSEAETISPLADDEELEEKVN